MTVALPGGPLHIEWTGANRILMTGAAELEYEDRLAPGTLSPSTARL